MEKTIINLSNLDKSYKCLPHVIFRGEGVEDDEIGYSCSIQASAGTENVESAIVEYDVPFKNLEFLKFFSNIKKLVWRGKSLISLEGVENLKKLKRIIIIVDKRKPLKFSFFESNSYELLDVNDLRKEEVAEIGTAKYIDVLTLRDCKIEDFSSFFGCEIRYLDFSVYKNEKISGIYARGLKTLRFDGCSKLTEIVSDSLIDLDYVEIQSCNKFNLDSLKGVVRCKILRVSLCKNPVLLSQVVSIENLEKLSLVNCKLTIDYEELEFLNGNNALKEVLISPLKSAELKQLKEKFPNISWQTI